QLALLLAQALQHVLQRIVAVAMIERALDQILHARPDRVDLMRQHAAHDRRLGSLPTKEAHRDPPPGAFNRFWPQPEIVLVPPKPESGARPARMRAALIAESVSTVVCGSPRLSKRC